MSSKKSDVSLLHGGRRRVQKTFTQPSRAKQSFKDECDINNIMRRFEKTGVLEHVNSFQGRYGNFIDAPGYQEACNQVLQADAMFQSLPSAIRKRFANDPAAFLDFMADPANEDEARRLGLLPAPLQTASEPPEAAPTPAGVPGGPAKPGATEGAGSA